MASLMQWMSEPWEGRAPWEWGPPLGVPENPTRLQVYAALTAMQGDSCSFFAYGCLSGGGLYGQTGLTQDQYHVIEALSAFVAGWLRGGDNLEAPDMKAALTAEWERVRSLGQVTDEPQATT